MKFIKKFFSKIFKKIKRKKAKAKAVNILDDSKLEYWKGKKQGKNILGFKLVKSERIALSKNTEKKSNLTKSKSRQSDPEEKETKPLKSKKMKDIKLIPFKVLWSSGCTNKNDTPDILIKKYLMMKSSYERLKKKFKELKAERGKENAIEEVKVVKFYSELYQGVKDVENEGKKEKKNFDLISSSLFMSKIVDDSDNSKMV